MTEKAIVDGREIERRGGRFFDTATGEPVMIAPMRYTPQLKEGLSRLPLPSEKPGEDSIVSVTEAEPDQLFPGSVHPS